MASRVQERFRVPLTDKGELAASLTYTRSPGEWAVLYIHGFASTGIGEKGSAVEAACARRGWTFAAFDFRGHGQSTGTLMDLRPSGLLEDVEAVRMALAQRGVRRLGLVGSSMGGWAALWSTHRHPDVVAACALIAPAADFPGLQLRRLTAEQRETWRATGRRRIRNQYLDVEIGPGVMEEEGRFPPEEMIAAWSKPLLIFHGMNDDIVPYQESLAFVQQIAAADVELRLLKKGDHRLLEQRDHVAEAACDLFARCTG